MQREFLKDILAQNQMTCSFALKNISQENVGFRLTKQAASIGFIYRHIGETIHLFATFLGVPTNVRNTTIGMTDEGQGENIAESGEMVNNGFRMLEQLIDNTEDVDWSSLIDTPFFGKISRLRLFVHILFHNSHHCGQISMTLSRGRNYQRISDKQHSHSHDVFPVQL